MNVGNSVFLNLSFLTFNVGVIIQLRNELTAWCYSSALHSPLAFPSTGKKIQRPRRPCMTCPTSHYSSELISHLYPVPPLVSKHTRLMLTSGPLHWLTSYLLCLERLSLSICTAPTHLSSLCSNISISVRPSKNSLKWHHPFPTHSSPFH